MPNESGPKGRTPETEKEKQIRSLRLRLVALDARKEKLKNTDKREIRIRGIDREKNLIIDELKKLGVDIPKKIKEPEFDDQGPEGDEEY